MEGRRMQIICTRLNRLNLKVFHSVDLTFIDSLFSGNFPYHLPHAVPFPIYLSHLWPYKILLVALAIFTRSNNSTKVCRYIFVAVFNVFCPFLGKEKKGLTLSPFATHLSLSPICCFSWRQKESDPVPHDLLDLQKLPASGLNNTSDYIWGTSGIDVCDIGGYRQKSNISFLSVAK